MITFSNLKHHELFEIQSDIKIICDLKKNDYLKELEENDILALEGSPARREKARVREEETINRKKEALEAYEKAKEEIKITDYETIKVV